MTPNEFYCPYCGQQANSIFKDNTYQYIIQEESDQITEIFIPIELFPSPLGGEGRVRGTEQQEGEAHDD